MATYSTDFSEYTTAAAPSDWSQRWGNYSAKFTIEADGTIGGKILALDGTADSAASWDDIDGDANRATVEVLAKGRVQDLSTATDPNFALLVRGGAGRDGYYAGIVGTTTLRLRRVVSNTEATVTSATGFTFATNTWYWLRFQANGSALKVRVWADGDSEPGTWDIDTTDTNITAAGWVGVYSNGLNTEADWDYFSVGTNGDAAPSPGGGDVTAPVLSSPTGTATGSTTATVGATTDEANGTQYAVVTTSATAPSAAQIKAGQDHTGSAAAWNGSITISATGANTHSATGLTASTGYYAHLIHTDAAANDSNIVSSAQFTTSAPADPPVITGQPSNATVKRGQTATFTVTATGSGTVTYQWQRNPGGVGSWADISGATSSSYTTPATTISGGSANDQDDYRCNVSDDDAGPVASDVVTLTVQQCVLALNAAGYEFGDGNDPATMSVVASTELQVAAYPLTEWPPASAIATATATTGTNGRLADLGDDDLIFGTTYRVIARNASDGETWAWTMTAS